MTVGAPKWRTIKTVFSLPEVTTYLPIKLVYKIGGLASGHLLLPVSEHSIIFQNMLCFKQYSLMMNFFILNHFPIFYPFGFSSS